MSEKIAEKQHVLHEENVQSRPEASRDVGMGLPLAPDLSPEEEAKLWLKIDKRLLPMLALMYLMSFLDRGNIGVPCLSLQCDMTLTYSQGNAKVQGLTDELKLTGDQYNIALVSYYRNLLRTVIHFLARLCTLSSVHYHSIPLATH
jgi:hypothetical protein